MDKTPQRRTRIPQPTSARPQLGRSGIPQVVRRTPQRTPVAHLRERTIPIARLPDGRYVVPAKRGATINREGQPVVLSSPPELRQALERNAPLSVQTYSNLPQHDATWRDPRVFRENPNFRDVEAANFELGIYDGQEDIDEFRATMHDLRLDPDDISFDEDEIAHYVAESFDDRQLINMSHRTPIAHRLKESRVPVDVTLGLSTPGSSLERFVEDELEASYLETPDKKIEIQAWRKNPASTTVPFIETAEGTILGDRQVTIDRTVRRYPNAEIIERRAKHLKADHMGISETELDIQELDPTKKEEGQFREEVSLSSSITSAPGVVKRTTKRVYKTVTPQREIMPGINTANVLRLVEEESRLIEQMKNVPPIDMKGSFSTQYDLKKRLDKVKLEPKNVKRLENTLKRASPAKEDAPATPDLQPEIMAAFMHTAEQQGISMDGEPDAVCKYLFPEKDAAVVQVGAVLASSQDDLVVPLQVPKICPTEGHTASEMRARNAPKTPPKKKIPASYAKNLLLAESPPWLEETDAAQRPAEMATSSEDLDESALSSTRDDDIDVLEYVLTPQPPKHFSRFQLRGSQKPSWFPGYAVALPYNLKIAKSVSEVLPAAWQAVQPDIFAEDSFRVLS